MDDPQPDYAECEEEFEADRQDVLSKVATFANSNGLGDESLITQFGAYLRDPQERLDRPFRDWEHKNTSHD